MSDGSKESEPLGSDARVLSMFLAMDVPDVVVTAIFSSGRVIYFLQPKHSWKINFSDQNGPRTPEAILFDFFRFQNDILSLLEKKIQDVDVGRDFSSFSEQNLLPTDFSDKVLELQIDL